MIRPIQNAICMYKEQIIYIFDLDLFSYTRNLQNKRFKPVLSTKSPLEDVNSQWLFFSWCQIIVLKLSRFIKIIQETFFLNHVLRYLQVCYSAIQPPPYSLPSSPYNLPLSKKHYWKSYHQQEKMKNKVDRQLDGQIDRYSQIDRQIDR